MIVRIFRVRILPGMLREWQHKVETISIPWLRQQQGLIAFYPGKPVDAEVREFSMTSIWKDLEALQNAVGQEWQDPVLLEDEAELALLWHIFSRGFAFGIPWGRFA